MSVCEHIKAKGAPEFMSLYDHLCHVRSTAKVFAYHMNFDSTIAELGAVLHDIGKASPIFQERLVSRLGGTGYKTFRHEIASCFFLSLVDEKYHPELIEMIIAHHKSIESDKGLKGIIDLEENEGDVFESHISKWDIWKSDALTILKAFDIKIRDITRKEAEENYVKTLKYCEDLNLNYGYSRWRGFLMSADHFASALSDGISRHLYHTFKVPDLSFYNRESELYPLSLKPAHSEKPHSLVVACTGAGKTDYLFRRCRGRVFYTLPFQASINAMFKRVKNDLNPMNPDLDIRILHSSSKIACNDDSHEDIFLQRLVGSSIKVLTPYQLASIVFATRGFESLTEDLRGCDVILDEIHTYDAISKSIVLKIVEVLDHIGCRIHIGTATMPSVLYNKIIELLGNSRVFEISLDTHELEMFDRHILHKITSWEEVFPVIDSAINNNWKILLICNRVESAQKLFERIRQIFSDIPVLLLHSRFKRKDRKTKEARLLGIDEKGKKTEEFNTSFNSCIVISTQVIEVSLDISFDLMVTETAPIDSLIQRFGRINRKRTKAGLGNYKPVYIIQPPENETDAKPYDLATLKKSFDVLKQDQVLHESEYQDKINKVYTDLLLTGIENHTAYKGNGKWNISMLTHRKRSILMDLLDIDSVNCILDVDCKAYWEADPEGRMMLEIPVRYYSVKNYFQLECGSDPFVIPDSGYSREMGLNIKKANETKADLNFI